MRPTVSFHWFNRVDLECKGKKNLRGHLVGPFGLFIPKNQIKTNFKSSILLIGPQQTTWHSETTNSFLDIRNLFSFLIENQNSPK